MVEDHLLEGFEELEKVFTDLGVTSRQRQLLPVGQPQLFLDRFELANRE